MNLSFIWSKLLKKTRGSAIKNSTIHKTAKIESGSHIVDSDLGKHSFCGYDCEIINCDIGSFCSIAGDVVIGGGMHPLEWVSTSPVFYEGRDSVKEKYSVHKRLPVKRTTVGHDVWIGQGVIVKQGVVIGDGAVIGMGSVVTKDVPSYSIVAGCPAKIIKNRFDIEIIEKLLEVKWWEFSDEKLKKYAPYFTDPESFLDKVRK